MDEAELYVALRDLLVAYRGKWSVDRVVAMAQAAGIRKRRLTMQEAVLEAIQKVVPGTETGTSLGTEMGTENTVAPSPLFSSPTPLSLTPDLNLPSAGPLLPFGRKDLYTARAKTTKNTDGVRLSEPSGDWQEALKAEVRGLFSVALSALSADQRTCLARYHCLAFGNCSRNENRNRYRATSVAPGIANLGWHKDFGQLTVKDYILAARAVHEKRDKKPWFSPWSVVAELERSQ